MIGEEKDGREKHTGGLEDITEMECDKILMLRRTKNKSRKRKNGDSGRGIDDKVDERNEIRKILIYI